MKVLYCVSECAPIVKVGGLGDVAGSLPRALTNLGAVNIRVVIPKYEDVRIYNPREIGELRVWYANVEEKVKIIEVLLGDISVILFENERYLSKDGHKAFAGTRTEVDRFGFFSKTIAEYINSQNYQIDILHLNDWHTSLVPLLLPTLKVQKIPTVLTIHNLSYQGIAPLNLLANLGLKSDSSQVLKWDAQNSDIDILMEGIIHATMVNTVSPTYAKEIMTSEYGFGIEEVLKGREGRVVGILNGIDYNLWNPASDSYLEAGYQTLDSRRGEGKNKIALQKELGLAIDENIPLLAFIGRLEPKQKGLDILYEALDELMPKENLQFVMLAVGDPEWEEKFKCQNEKFKEKMAFLNHFNERSAHRIYAGSDIILMPSKFEPCGLPQMIGMRYGSLPLVRETGGLADSVTDGKNGFVFTNYSSIDLVGKIREALGIYRSPKWEEMVIQAMAEDFSWKASAEKYLMLYRKAIELNNA